MNLRTLLFVVTGAQIDAATLEGWTPLFMATRPNERGSRSASAKPLVRW